MHAAAQNWGNHFVHAWDGHTTVHPLALTALIAMGVTSVMLPRRYSVWPILVIACFISQAQRIVIFGADFDFVRLMVIFGWARLLLRNELRPLAWRRLDYAFILWAVAEVVASVIRAGPDVLVNRLGFLFDSLGMYLLFRYLVRDWDDLKYAVLGCTVVAVPVAVAFAIETTTARNMFAVFGGVPEITAIRDDRLRCQGAFVHPILAGLFWASLLPLIAVQWWEGGRKRWVAVAGIVSALFIIVACASSTPVTGVMFAVTGGAMFFARRQLRAVRWGLVFVLVALHLVMKAPVWHLIARVDIVGGSSGYHRFQLIDGAIRNYNEWWIMGSTVGTAHWGHSTQDVTNYYVVQGLHGGILLLALFIAVIAYAYAAVGRLWRAVEGDRAKLMWSWGIGVALFVHTTSFVVITYFGQINVVWYLLLAIIGSLSSEGTVAYAGTRRQVAGAGVHSSRAVRGKSYGATGGRGQGPETVSSGSGRARIVSSPARVRATPSH